MDFRFPKSLEMKVVLIINDANEYVFENAKLILCRMCSPFVHGKEKYCVGNNFLLIIGEKECTLFFRHNTETFTTSLEFKKISFRDSSSLDSMFEISFTSFGELLLFTDTLPKDNYDLALSEGHHSLLKILTLLEKKGIPLNKNGKGRISVGFDRKSRFHFFAYYGFTYRHNDETHDFNCDDDSDVESEFFPLFYEGCLSDERQKLLSSIPTSPKLLKMVCGIILRK